MGGLKDNVNVKAYRKLHKCILQYLPPTDKSKMQ